MAFWFYRGLRRGIATTRYPDEIDVWTRGLPSPPAFHSNRLTVELAHRLVRECGTGALRHDGHELVVDIGRCTGCGRCIELSDGTAEPSGEFLLAAISREGLLKRVPLRGEHEGAV
jgi:hypothetical protein